MMGLLYSQIPTRSNWDTNPDFDWAVIDLTGLNIKSIDAFSHFSEVGTAAPIPGAIILLGSGLIGLSGVSRKCRFKRG
jgi:hypothetical protein